MTKQIFDLQGVVIFRHRIIHAVCRVSENTNTNAPQRHFLRGVDRTFCGAIKLRHSPGN